MSVADDLNRAVRKTGKQRNLVAITLIAVLAGGAYFGAGSYQETLQDRGQAALDDAALPADRINVSLHGRTAKLTGFADSQREADAAEAAVAEVVGVRTVENFLQVRQQPLLTGPAGEPPNAAAELLASAPEAGASTSPSSPIAGMGPDGQQTGAPEASAPDQDRDAATDSARTMGDDAASTQERNGTRTGVVENGVSHLRAEWSDGRLTVTGALSSAAEHRRLRQVLTRDYADARVVDEVVVRPGLPMADWLPGFVAHLPNLRAQDGASMESSAAGLRPAEADQARYVLASAAEPESAPPPAPVSAAQARTDAARPVADDAASVASTGAAAESGDSDEANADIGHWLHLRGQSGRVAISGTLGGERERQALAAALRVVYSPSATYNGVRLADEAGSTAWLETLNSLWVLLQPIEFLDLEISDRLGVAISGWAPSEDQSQRILATLRAKLAPLPVRSGLRSIQAQQESYATADLFNRNYARGIGFARDGVSLSWAGHVSVGQLAKHLRRQPAVRLRIGVHTDSRGDAEANRRLTQARADAIAARLIELGIAAGRIDAVGHGDARPIADNRTPVGRALNRRIVFSPL